MAVKATEKQLKLSSYIADWWLYKKAQSNMSMFEDKSKYTTVMHTLAQALYAEFNRA